MTVQSTCNYCGVGCNLDYQLDDDGNLTKVKATPDYPVNKGVLCPKGFKIHEPILSEERGVRPLVRRDGRFVPVDWNQAVDSFTGRVHELQQKYGEKSVAFISTGQMYTEEMALLGQVARTGMKIHGDGNTRQCMASAVVGYKQAFGFDSPPFTYKDIELSDCIILIGSNASITHPIVWVRAQKHNKEAFTIVVDPRASETAQKAAMHMPVKPKRDIILLYMAMNELIRKDWIDKDFIARNCSGFDELKAHVSNYDPKDVEELTGITRDQFNTFVEKIHGAKRLSIWWTMGVNQGNQGTRTAQAIIDICLLTGNIGRPGTGPCSLTGQANAMGSRMFSNTTCLYGGRDYASPEHRRYVADVLKIDADRLPAGPTMPYNEIIDSVENGTIKGLWIIATNFAHSWVNTNKLERILGNLELLVVQDLYPSTLSAQHADMFFPAGGAGEKEGFLINSERRLGAAQKVMDPPGEAKSDFDIFLHVAKSYGCEDVIPGWDSPAAVFKLLRACSKGQPCDFTGIRDYKHMLESGGIQWPFPEGSPPADQERRLFEDGRFFTPDGKAKLLFEEFQPPIEEPDAEYPFYLLTGRGSIVQFQTNTRTIKSVGLKKVMSDNLYVEISEADAQKLLLSEGSEVRIRSRRGEISASARISKGLCAGHIFLPFHYEETNRLIGDEFDTYSKEPSFKVGAVQVSAA